MVGTTEPTMPNRDRFRAQRSRRAERRRRLMGIPVVLVGLALIGLGAWMWDREHQPTESPRPTVAGTSVVAPTSTRPTTPTTLLPVESFNGSTVPVAPPVGSAGG